MAFLTVLFVFLLCIPIVIVAVILINNLYEQVLSGKKKVKNNRK